MTSGVDGPWVLCRSAPTKEVLVIMESDYNYWKNTYPNTYEFIAKGTRSDLQAIRKLILD